MITMMIRLHDDDDDNDDGDDKRVNTYILQILKY